MTGIYRLLVLYYHLQKSQVRSVKILSLLSAILLGLIQGVTEFLPISSSGHLAIAENLLHMSRLIGGARFF